MATPPVTEWDAQGKPIQASQAPAQGQPTEWDASGQPISSQPDPDTRSLFQKAKDNFNAATQGAKTGDGAVKGFVENVGAGGGDAIRGAAHFIEHPIDTTIQAAKDEEAKEKSQSVGEQILRHALGPASSLYDIGKSLVQQPGRTIGNIGTGMIVGEGAAEAVPSVVKAAGTAASAVGDAAQDAGTGLINKTVGTLKSDFKRGANPGRGYLETGNGPALTMQGVADNAGAAKQAVGKALGDAYAKASDSGVKIPVDVVAKEMAKPIQKAIDLATGPGGTGDTATIKNYLAQFGPTFDKAAENGGFTPKELFDMKQQIAQNTNWSDPAQFSLKTVRQQQTGALSGLLSDAVPETADLNQHYQDLTKMAARAGDRAKTGSSPLTALATKVGMMAASGAAGSHYGLPTAAAATAAGSIIDTIPAKTTLATGLYRGGAALSAFGERLAPASSAPVEEIPAQDLKSDQGNANARKPDNGVRQGPPPQLTDGTNKGSAAWIDSGISKLSDHIAADPSSGVTVQQITNLAKTPAGKSLLMRASSLAPGSAMMRDVAMQVKKLLGP